MTAAAVVVVKGDCQGKGWWYGGCQGRVGTIVRNHHPAGRWDRGRSKHAQNGFPAHSVSVAKALIRAMLLNPVLPGTSASNSLLPARCRLSDRRRRSGASILLVTAVDRSQCTDTVRKIVIHVYSDGAVNESGPGSRLDGVPPQRVEAWVEEGGCNCSSNVVRDFFIHFFWAYPGTSFLTMGSDRCAARGRRRRRPAVLMLSVIAAVCGGLAASSNPRSGGGDGARDVSGG